MVKLFMFKIRLILTLSIFGLFVSCSEDVDNYNNENQPENEEEITSNQFSVDDNFILKNEIPINIKGVVYVPGYPGFLPWEIEQSTSLPNNLKESINNDIAIIKAMGANTIRFWGAPKHCYTALQALGDLNFIQTIWIDGAVPDFQDVTFKEEIITNTVASNSGNHSNVNNSELKNV